MAGGDIAFERIETADVDDRLLEEVVALYLLAFDRWPYRPPGCPLRAPHDVSIRHLGVHPAIAKLEPEIGKEPANQVRTMQFRPGGGVIYRPGDIPPRELAVLERRDARFHFTLGDVDLV
ncbi:MAG: hypothetical protein R3190_09340, partial [Thermoanaerobaculia bacterium]|nr:hypothetical protein [Thermoanaerobaculia bacterium]